MSKRLDVHSTQSDNLKRDIAQILLGVYDYGRSIGQGISYKDDDFNGIDPTIACRGILKLVEKAEQEARVDECQKLYEHSLTWELDTNKRIFVGRVQELLLSRLRELREEK